MKAEITTKRLSPGNYDVYLGSVLIGNLWNRYTEGFVSKAESEPWQFTPQEEFGKATLLSVFVAEKKKDALIKGGNKRR